VPWPKGAIVTRPDLVLDSDVLIEILRGRPEASQWLTSLGSQTVGISVVTRMEILRVPVTDKSRRS